MADNHDKPPGDIEIYNGENRYLMGSSLLFLLPGTHAFYRQKYMLSSILLVGPLVSYKYWSKPRNNIWRTADMACNDVAWTFTECLCNPVSNICYRFEI